MARRSASAAKQRPRARAAPANALSRAASGNGHRRQLSQRGERTRARLVAAARQVFEATGYSAARVTDIADAAGVAHGSFYTYFDSKEAVCRAVIDVVLADMYAATRSGEDAHFHDPLAAIADSNQRYYDAYRRNRQMLVILDEISGFNPSFQLRRQELRTEFVDRYTAVLTHLRDTGAVRKDLDPHHTAGALGAMVDNSLRWWLGREEQHDDETAVETLNKLWAGALGLEPTVRQPTKRGGRRSAKAVKPTEVSAEVKRS